MRFLDVFGQARRREPEALAGELLANDGYFGIFCLGVALVVGVHSDLAGALQCGGIGLVLIGAPVLVAIRPGATDRVLVCMGALLAAAALFTAVEAIHYLISEPDGGLRYAPGFLVWLQCHASLHWVATGTRRTWVRRLPRVALVTGIAAEIWIICLVAPRFARVFFELSRWSH